jgi:hypothetical protein
MTDMNARIREAAGRTDPREVAAAAIAAAEAAGDASGLRERIAEQVGLPTEMGARLKGQDAGELKADAEKLAAAVGGLNPPRPDSMNDRIRQAAGHTAVNDLAAADEPPRPTSMDGGARQSTSPPPPSMSSLIRGTLDAKRELAHDNAEFYDRD